MKIVKKFTEQHCKKWILNWRLRSGGAESLGLIDAFHFSFSLLIIKSCKINQFQCPGVNFCCVSLKSDINFIWSLHRQINFLHYDQATITSLKTSDYEEVLKCAVCRVSTWGWLGKYQKPHAHRASGASFTAEINTFTAWYLKCLPWLTVHAEL